MKKRSPRPRPRGRPRSPDIARLIPALIAKQDAMSRRTARRINVFLDEHVTVAQAAHAWANLAWLTREKFGPGFVDGLVALLAPADPKKFRAECGRLVADALANLDRGDTLFGPAPATQPPGEPRVVVRRSRTLAEARAQVALLQTKLMDLQARIVPLRAMHEPS